MRKYIFKTQSDDPRPIIHSTNIWAVVGTGISDKRGYYLLVMWLESGDDLFKYYPEAYDVVVQQDKHVEIKRGGEQDILCNYRRLDYRQGITFMDDTVNPTFLAIVENMSYQGLSDGEMAKRMGLNYNKFKKLKSHPDVQAAIGKGLGRWLSSIAEKI
jgi:hypothetical protein